VEEERNLFQLSSRSLSSLHPNVRLDVSERRHGPLKYRDRMDHGSWNKEQSWSYSISLAASFPLPPPSAIMGRILFTFSFHYGAHCDNDSIYRANGRGGATLAIAQPPAKQTEAMTERRSNDRRRYGPRLARNLCFANCRDLPRFSQTRRNSSANGERRTSRPAR